MPLVAVGLWDDFSEARTLVRLIAQVLSALVMVYVAGVVVRDLGSLIHADHPVILHSWAVPLTIFCTVGAINAVNMIDGLDGLAGGVVLIALGWFAVAGAIVGDRFDTALAVVFMGAVAGFLAFNLRNPLRKQATVFLGDTGSMVLGFMLAWFSVRLTQVEGGGLMPMAAVWIIGLPLLDTLSVIVWRSVRGRSPLSADRNHLHYVLLRAGFSPRQTVAILLLVALAFGGFGVGVWLAGLPDSILFWGSLAVYAVYLAVMWRVWPAMESRADAQRS
jgi:UDP-GlcNAc:undecaprenyl-phosphate GlcNAc-1-phosphate transferase